VSVFAFKLNKIPTEIAMVINPMIALFFMVILVVKAGNKDRKIGLASILLHFSCLYIDNYLIFEGKYFLKSHYL
jgi:hypothetical protein